jgi:type II secretory pathway pseudopilin PulG
MRFTRLQRQRGVTLVVALVMLVIISMLAISTFNLGKSSIQVVGNMQSRDEAIAASRQVIDEALSNKLFFESPDDTLNQPCNGPNTRCIDVNGDGMVDITTTLTPSPSCVKARTIKVNELDFTNTEDQNCSVGEGGTGLIVGAKTGNSLCANSTWEITAVSTDAVTESRVEVVQGVNVRVSTDDVETSCK